MKVPLFSIYISLPLILLLVLAGSSYKNQRVKVDEQLTTDLQEMFPEANFSRPYNLSFYELKENKYSWRLVALVMEYVAYQPENTNKLIKTIGDELVATNKTVMHYSCYYKLPSHFQKLVKEGDQRYLFVLKQ